MAEDKREQVAAQCKAVAHLARALLEIHEDYERMLRAGIEVPIDIVGERTASFMETLGDMLNGMDATDEDDVWMEPVFAEAQRLWPTKPEDLIR